MQGEFCTVFTTKKPSRENFVPNARQRSSGPTQQHTRHPRCEAESPGGTTGPGRGASCGRLAGPAWVGRASMGWQGQHGLAGPAWVGRASARQISHAIPPRHKPTQAQKPQNINDQISIPEILSGELHAKLPINSQNWATCSNPKHGRATSRRAEPPISTPGTGVEGPGGSRGARPPCPWVPDGRAAVPVGGGGAWSRQISHIISDGHFLRSPKNVAIPTR